MFCFGVLLGSFLPTWSMTVGIALIIIPFAAAVLTTRRDLRLFFLLIVFFSIGIFRLQQATLPEHVETVGDHSGAVVRVEGEVVSEVETRSDHQRAVLDSVYVVDQSVEGKLLLKLPLYPEVFFGDTLVFSCALQQPEPFNGFAYDAYLATQGILAICSFPQHIDVRTNENVSAVGMLLSLKQQAIDQLKTVFHEPHAAFISGLLFGGNSMLPNDLKDQFAATGTSHILAASGFNVSLFSFIFLSWILSTRLRRSYALVITALLILAYVVLAGATPAVIRAGLMGLVVLVQVGIARKASLANTMLLAAALMLLVNPMLLLHDVGFQLSFVATWAVLALTEPLKAYVSFLPKRFQIRQSFAASVGAIVITLPIILFHFAEFSIVAPFANLLVLPLVPYLMAFAIIALLINIFSLSAALIVAIPAWALSTVILWLITSFGSVSFASVEILHRYSFSFLALLCALAFVVYVKKDQAH